MYRSLNIHAWHMLMCQAVTAITVFLQTMTFLTVSLLYLKRMFNSQQHYYSYNNSHKQGHLQSHSSNLSERESNFEEEQRQFNFWSLPESLLHNVGHIRVVDIHKKTQNISWAAQMSESIILAPASTIMNSGNGNLYYYRPSKSKSSKYWLEGQSQDILIKKFQFFGELKDRQCESRVLAIGLLSQPNPLQTYLRMQLSKGIDLGQTIHILGKQEQNQSDQRVVRLNQENRVIKNTVAKVLKVSSLIMQYQIKEGEQKTGLLDGAPIFIKTAEGPKLLGLHIGKSLSSHNAYYGLMLSPQFRVPLEQFQLQFALESQASTKKQLSSTNQKNFELKNNQHLPQMGKYLTKRINNKKVQVFKTLSNITIRLYDSIKQTIIYSKLTQQYLNTSQQLISNLEYVFDMLEYQLQQQQETLDHIFRIDEQGLLQVKLQHEPIVSIKMEARCSILAQVEDINEHSLEKAKEEINSFMREKMSDLSDLARQIQERISLKLTSCHYQLQQILQKAKKNIQASVSQKSQSMAKEVIDNLQQQVQKYCSNYKIKEREQQNNTELKDRLHELTQIMDKCKKQIKELALQTRAIEMKSQVSLQEIKVRMDGDSFINQMNFSRLQEISTQLSMKLQGIERQIAGIKGQGCSTINNTLFEANSDSLCESAVEVKYEEKGQKTRGIEQVHEDFKT